MLNLRREKSFRATSVYGKNSDSGSVTSTATRRNEAGILCLPKNLEDVAKSQHGNTPKNLPGDNACQDEVRYYLYSVLTCKDNSSAKRYPQWVLETCTSWEGTGHRLRNMTDEELQILCPLRAGYAEINPSRKYKLDELPLPAARQTIGAAIARAVTASRLAESRKNGVHREWDDTMRRSIRRYESAEDLRRQINGLQLHGSPEVRSRSSMLNLSGPESLHCFSWDNPSMRTYSPVLPNVNESHNEPSYEERQIFASIPRPTPLPRHINGFQYSRSVDSSSIESPGSSNGLVGSIVSQDSNSTSHTVSSGPETTSDTVMSPKIDRRVSSASLTASITQPVPCHENKETLAELEAGPIEMPANQAPLGLSKPPRRYRANPSYFSASSVGIPPSLTQSPRQLDEIYRPSGLRNTVQTGSFGHFQNSYHGYPEHPLPFYNGNTMENQNPGRVLSPHVEASSYTLQSTENVNMFQSQVEQQVFPYDNNQLNDQPLNFRRSLLRPAALMQPQMKLMGNGGPQPVHNLQSFSYNQHQLQQDEHGSFPLPNWAELTDSQSAKPVVASHNGIRQPDDFQIYAFAQPNFPQFPFSQSAHNSSLPGVSVRSDVSVHSVPTIKPSVPSRVWSATNTNQAGVYNRPASVASRSANSHRIDSLALDQAGFHVWKGKPSIEKTMVAYGEDQQLARSQTENLYLRTREQRLRAAWNSDLRGHKGSSGPTVRYLDPMTGRPRQTFYEAIEEREILDGKPQRGVERGLAQDWRRYH